jgi:hypothetical protein
VAELDLPDPDAGAVPPAVPDPSAPPLEQDFLPEPVAISSAAELERLVRASEVQSAAFVARQQAVLLLIVSGLVVALVALGLQPYAAVSTAFATGVAAIELQRRGRGRPSD